MFRKFTLLALGLLWAGFSQAQTVAFEEKFEGTGIPVGWSQSGTGWKFGQAASLRSNAFYFNALSGKLAVINDDKAGANGLNENQRLVTRSIDFTGIDHPFLNFNFYYMEGTYEGKFETAQVEVSVDSGLTWQTAKILTGDENYWQTAYIDLSEYGNQSNVMIGFTYDDGGGGWLYGLVLDNIQIFQPNELDLNLIRLENYPYVLKGNAKITGKVINTGFTYLNGLKVNYQVNGGDVVTQNVNFANPLEPFKEANFIHPTNIAIAENEIYNVKVWIEPQDASLVEATPANNEKTTSLFGLSQSAPKSILMEEFTGAWCPYCPAGHIEMKKVLAANPKVIGVAIHSRQTLSGSEVMEIPEGFEAVQKLEVSGFPTAAIDRYYFIGDETRSLNVGSWKNGINQKFALPSPVSVSFKSNFFNEVDGSLQTKLSIKTFGKFEGDYRVNLYVVEDSVSGGLAYNQANAYDKATSNNGLPVIPELFGLGNPIPNYIHRDVVRIMAGGSQGLQGSLPSNLEPNQEYTYTFNLNVPETFVYSRLNLVAIVQEVQDGEIHRNGILNSAKIKITKQISETDTTVSVTDLLDKNIEIFPNPTNGSFYVSNAGEQPVTVKVFNLNGMLLFETPAAVQTPLLPVNMENAPQGVYFVEVSSGAQKTTRKVVKN